MMNPHGCGLQPRRAAAVPALAQARPPCHGTRRSSPATYLSRSSTDLHPDPTGYTTARRDGATLSSACSSPFRRPGARTRRPRHGVFSIHEVASRERRTRSVHGDSLGNRGNSYFVNSDSVFDCVMFRSRHGDSVGGLRPAVDVRVSMS